MKKITLLLFSLTAFWGFSQNTVTADPAAAWLSYMNVFDTGGNFQFGQGGAQWTLANLQTTIGASDITLQPNFNAYAENVGGTPGDIAYWTNSPDGGTTPGPTGNKLMEASTFVEPGPSFNEEDLTFSGVVTSNTLAGTVNGGFAYTTEFFIKALDPAASFSDALGGAYVLPLPSSGAFSVTVTGGELTAGLIVQYGFRIYGLNANPDDEATLGSVVVGATAGINDFDLAKFNVYPNPSNNVWNIKGQQTVDKVEVYDVLGKQVMTVKPNDSDIELDASTLPKGLYFAKMTTDLGSNTIKLIKN
jgi:hypothetical protein